MLPVGFKFLPTDVELIGEYLKYKLTVGVFPQGYGYEKLFMDIDVYQYNPDDLIRKHTKLEEEQTEWFFFSSRGRKYRNGSRPDRTAGNGYWKSTGKDKLVKNDDGVLIGYVRVLDFYVGKQPKGERTDWKMHEYLLKEQRDSHRNISRTSHQGSQQLDRWVLCKIYISRRGKKEDDGHGAGAGDDANEDDRGKDGINYNNSQQIESPLPLWMQNAMNPQYCQNFSSGYNYNQNYQGPRNYDGSQRIEPPIAPPPTPPLLNTTNMQYCQNISSGYNCDQNYQRPCNYDGSRQIEPPLLLPSSPLLSDTTYLPNCQNIDSGYYYNQDYQHYQQPHESTHSRGSNDQDMVSNSGNGNSIENLPGYPSGMENVDQNPKTLCSLPMQNDVGGLSNGDLNADALLSSIPFESPNHSQGMINGSGDCNLDEQLQEWIAWLNDVVVSDD